jgi:succinoglycan biosynthesis protein ExoA
MHTAWAIGFFDGMLSLREQAWRPEAATPLWDSAPVGASHD